MERRTRLLVHAGASSSKTDDNDCIQKAHSYLALDTASASNIIQITGPNADSRPFTGIAVSPIPGRAYEPNTAADGMMRSQYDKAYNGRIQDSCEYVDDTQIASTRLESPLFMTSTPVGERRRLSGAPSSRHRLGGLFVEDLQKRGREDMGLSRADEYLPAASTHPRHGTETDGAYESSYMRTPTAVRSFKRVRSVSRGSAHEEAGNQTQAVERLLFPTGHGKSLPQATQSPHSQGRRTASDTITSDETTSELPRSYSLSDITANSRDDSIQDRPQVSDRSASDPVPVPNAQEAHSHTADALPQSQEPTKNAVSHAARVILQQVAAGDTPRDALSVETILAIAQKVVPHLSVTNDSRAIRAGVILNPEYTQDENVEATLHDVPVELHAPSPQVSVDEFKTHVTKELRSLFQAFSAKYAPVAVSRRVHIHERGYWSVDCTSWHLAKRLAFWHHMQTWIGNGSAGWGVWATRAADSRLVARNSFEEMVFETEARNQLDRVRVYCWGEVVAHMYLLLYTASEGGVRKAGLQWVDSGGVVVVQMKGSDH